MTMTFTTIPISKKLRDRLKAYGKMGETYEELLNRLLNELNHIREMRKGYE